MNAYTITVAPSDGSGNTTTISVDTSHGDVRVTDVHLHAGAGLTATRLPSIDIGLLLQAVSPQPALDQAPPLAAPVLTGEPAQSISTAANDTGPAGADTSPTAADSSDTPADASAVAADSADTAADTSAVAADSADTAADTSDTAQRSTPRGRRRRTAEEPTVPASTAPRTRKRAQPAAPKATVARAATPKATVAKAAAPRTDAPKADAARVGGRKADSTKAAAARAGSAKTGAATAGTTARKTQTVKTPATGRERAYRRMPDDLTAVARRLNSASAIAEHYQVPRHTAQGWLGRLRAAATA